MTLLILSFVIDVNGQIQRLMESILKENDPVAELFMETPNLEDLQAWLAQLLTNTENYLVGVLTV